MDCNNQSQDKDTLQCLQTQHNALKRQHLKTQLNILNTETPVNTSEYTDTATFEYLDNNRLATNPLVSIGMQHLSNS